MMVVSDWNEFLDKLPDILKDKFSAVDEVTVHYPTVYGPTKHSLVIDVYVSDKISIKKLRRLVNDLSGLLQGSVYKGSVTRGATGHAEEFEGRLEPSVRVNILDARHLAAKEDSSEEAKEVGAAKEQT